MNPQLSFADLVDPVLPQGQALTIDQQFLHFHRANPHIYGNLKALALNAARKGQKFGIKALFEILRWQYAQASRGDQFKLNNNYTALYARMLMHREPELSGYFETRSRRTAVTRQAVLSGLEKVTA